MQQPLLSILIPTVFGRELEYKKLWDRISYLCKNLPQYNSINNYGFLQENPHDSLVGIVFGGLVSIQTIKDNKEITIGEKRERLYKMSIGLFSWQIDDDDDISDNAIELILEAIKSNSDVDCITFEENCIMNHRYYKSNHSIKYGGWQGDGSIQLSDGFHFWRTPFYKDVIKTSIAQSVPFHYIRFGEDHQWAIDLYPHLKTEYHIDKELYFYIHNPKESHNERYGIKE